MGACSTLLCVARNDQNSSQLFIGFSKNWEMQIKVASVHLIARFEDQAWRYKANFKTENEIRIYWSFDLFTFVAVSIPGIHFACFTSRNFRDKYLRSHPTSFFNDVLINFQVKAIYLHIIQCENDIELILFIGNAIYYATKRALWPLAHDSRSSGWVWLCLPINSGFVEKSSWTPLM